MTAEEFEKQLVDISAVAEESDVRKRKIVEHHDGELLLVQLTCKDVMLVFNLTETKPFIIDQLSDIEQFQNPLHFTSCGFNYVTA